MNAIYIERELKELRGRERKKGGRRKKDVFEYDERKKKIMENS